MAALRHMVPFVLGAVALAPCPAHSQDAAAGAALLGLWAADSTFGPAARGRLTLTQDTLGWHARIAGMTGAFAVPADSVRFELPGNEGGFRGVLTAHGRLITGFWIQPPGVVLDQALASPVTLRRVGPKAWAGPIVPLPDRFTLYAAVSRDSTGSLQAAFRNPQLNSRGGSARFNVARDGDSAWFSARPDPSGPEIRFAAALEPDGTLRLRWPDLRQTLVLRRVPPTRAPGFYPRPPHAAPYRYRQPPEGHDGWRTARASRVGLNERALQRLVRSIADTDPAAPRSPLIHALLIARRGRLVLEEYFYGHDRSETHDTRSASKTFASVLVGAAQASGAGLSPDTRIYELLAPDGPFANPDPRKQWITVGELMTHTSGLACDDNDDASPGNEDRMQAQTAQPDWWKYTLDLPVAYDPGTHYAYCSAGMNLAGAALTAATGTWLPALFDSLVARPLDFGRYYFNLMPTGQGYFGGGLRLLPRDLLKLGQAYLDSGLWRGRRLVPAAWVATSTRLQSDSSGGTDGFAWHLNVLRSGGREYREFEANGNGGQFVIVVPELDLAVAFTAGNYGQYGIWRHFRDDIVPEIIAAGRW